MKLLKRASQVLGLIVGLAFAGEAIAQSKTLITMEGGKPKAGLAKAWKEVKATEYEFELDPKAEVKKGTPVSAAAVKDTLESKLGTTFGVKVTDKGSNKISVTFTGDKNKFLEQVGKTKIRADKNVEIALESSVSEGGIRADPGNRPPTANEVKATIVKIEKGQFTATVNESKHGTVKSGTVKVKTDTSKLKMSQKVFFVPEKQDGGAWVPKAGSVKSN